MAQIKHIAIRTHEVEKTARFYREAFGLEQVGVGKSGIYLTDGHLNIAILHLRPAMDGETMKLGVDHIGFQVDDLAATLARVREAGGQTIGEPNEVPIAQHSTVAQTHFEVKCLAPDHQVIDIANGGWPGAR